MKCVKSVKQTKQVNLGEIIRTTDEDAQEKVRGGFWVYAKKVEWKEGRTSNKKTETTISTEETEEVKVKKGKSKKELKSEKKRNR